MIGSAWFHILPVIPIFSNPHEIVSPYIRDNFNPLNNYLRFVLYVFSPLILWMILSRIFRSWMGKDSNWLSPQGYKFEWIFASGLFLFLALCSFPGFFYFDRSKLDGFWFFEQGAWMVPAWQYLQTGKIWLGTFFAHGLIYDLFLSIWAWKISGIVNIASDRYIVAFLGNLLVGLNLLLLWALAYFAYIHKAHDFRRATCLLLLMSTFFYATHNQWQYWDRRDVPVLLGTVCFLFSFHLRLRAGLIITGILMGITWLFTLERGAYFTGAVGLFYLAFALISKNWKLALRDLCFIALGGFATLFFLIANAGWEEVVEGLRTSFLRMQTKDLVDGNAYRNPAFPISNYKFLASKFTFPLVCLALQILNFYLRWRAGKCEANRIGNWTTQLFLLLISLLYYRSALSRSDEVHWCYSSSFAFIGAAYSSGILVFESRIFSTKVISLLTLALVTIIPLQRFQGGILGLHNFFSQPFPSMKKELNVPDSIFLTGQQARILPYLEEEFKDEKCFYSIASEPFWSYLLKKPFCGRFYITWLIPSKSFQFEAIEEVKQFQPGKILMRTPLSGWAIDGIPVPEQQKYLYSHLLNHYQKKSEKEGWEVWERKKISSFP